MADATRPAVGLSIGATNLAAVTADRAVIRKPVLTLYGQRPPEVGVPSENPNLGEPGLVITDFVNRVGDPAGVVGADGSTHRSEALVADALRALSDTATRGRTMGEAVAVSYPAHWRPAAVDALDAALNRIPEFSGDGQPVRLFPDAAAAVTALQTNPGLPSRGIIAVCDFGGSGTSLTFVDAANGYQPVAATVRHAEFSGDMIDQALLNHVIADLSAAGSFDTSSTSAIGSLTRLRADCRRAKEQLSSSTVATVTTELPGFRGDIQLTRAQLDDAIRQPLDAFIAVIQETLQRNGIQLADVAAVAVVGGGANIPAVTTTLSDRLRLPVVTAPRPHLAAAIGAALAAARGPADEPATALAPTAEAVSPLAEATTMLDSSPGSSGAPPLAWSEADDDSGIMPLRTGEYPAQSPDAGATPARPPVRVDQHARRDEARQARVPWYRRPAVVIIGTALVVLAIGAAVMIALRHTSSGAPGTPAPSVSTAPGPGSSAPGSPGTQNPTESQPSDTNQPPSSTQSTTTQPSSTQTTTQQSTSQATTTQAPSSASTQPVYPYPRFPGSPQPGTGGR